ncbi:MAG: histidinol-phosphate transaminase [Elusimicrobiota bacterium]|nr:histidinol-phosphate transaminase [Endomicrobiia bacterium]MDW8164892.1 histidinol-phosphate transaminase [Elusimicrobiota bacterium]
MNENTKPIPRKEIKNFQPYIPGRPIEEIKEKFKLKYVVKLASNENPLGCSKKVKPILKNLSNVFHRYPEGSSLILRQKIAKKFGVSVDEVIVGAGTDELIELVVKTYVSKESNIVVSKHAFIRYKMAGELMGCEVIEVPMKNYTHDLEKMVQKVNKKTKVVFIANPNNPTGTYNTTEELVNFLNYLNNKKLYPIVVIDEAYYEYAKLHNDYPDTLKLRSKYPNFLILRTFSKIYGLAGLRVGFGISRREIVSELDRVRPPFNVSVVAQYIASKALEDDEHIENSLNLIIKEKRFLYNELEKISLKYIPSAANFILIDVFPYLGRDVFQKLLKHGVIVRAMDEYELYNYIRVTIGTHKENLLFIRALKKVLKEGIKV